MLMCHRCASNRPDTNSTNTLSSRLVGDYNGCRLLGLRIPIQHQNNRL